MKGLYFHKCLSALILSSQNFIVNLERVTVLNIVYANARKMEISRQQQNFYRASY